MGILAERMAQVSVSATLKVAAEAERLRRAGFNVVDFSAGEPDFPTPEHVKAAGKAAFYEPDTAAIIDRVSGLAGKGDVIVVFSNGGFDNIHAKLLEALMAKS